MREYANLDIESILSEIEKHISTKTHKSALEVLQILTDNKDGNLKQFKKEKWFIHYETRLDNLIYSNEKTWNTPSFEKSYQNIVPMIHYSIQKSNEK